MTHPHPLTSGVGTDIMPGVASIALTRKSGAHPEADNGISIDGPTSLSFSEDVLARFGAYGWHVQRIDGHTADAVETAIRAAQAETARPSLIACKTHIGASAPYQTIYRELGLTAEAVTEAAYRVLQNTDR